MSSIKISPSSDVAPKRERRKEARPRELLDAALDLFVEKGFAGTRAEEVAARAGVSKGTLFLYFSSKEELFKAVVRENLSNNFSQWGDEFMAFEGSTAELVAHCMHQWWERIGATRASGITKLVMSEASNFPEIAEFYQREVVIPGSTLLLKMLQRGVDSGEFRRVDSGYAIYGIIAPMIFLQIWKHGMANCGVGHQIDPRAFVASQVDMLINGIKA